MKLGCRKIVVGCDLNTQLPQNHEQFTGPACFKHAAPHHEHRVDMTIALLNDFGLVALNTFGDTAKFTRVSWKNKDDKVFSFQHCSQIDYLFVSHAVASSSEAVVCNLSRLWRSDHFPLTMKFKTERGFPTKAVRSQYAGWKPACAEDCTESFCEKMMDGKSEDPFGCIEKNFTISIFSEAIETSALEVEHTSRGQREAQLQIMPERSQESTR